MLGGPATFPGGGNLAPSLVAEVGGDLETPPGIAYLYSVTVEEGTVILKDRLSHRLFGGGLLAVLGGMWPVFFLMFHLEPIYAIFALAGCLAFAVGVKTALTQVTYTLSRGRIVRRQSSPFGVTETDLSRASLQIWRSGSSMKLYLLSPGESIGPFTPSFVSLNGQSREQVASWLVAVTGLSSFRPA